MKNCIFASISSILIEIRIQIVSVSHVFDSIQSVIEIVCQIEALLYKNSIQSHMKFISKQCFVFSFVL